jgi:hypothetical protein
MVHHTRIFIIVPLFVGVSSAASAQVCKAGSEQWVAGCEARCTASWEGSNCPQSCTSTPPPGYVMVDHRSQRISENNGGGSISRLAADQTFNYSRSVKQAYSSAIKVAGQYKDYKARAELQDDMKQAIDEAEQFASSHQLLRLSVSASKHGSFFDRKRGWSHMRAEMLVRCIAPADLREQLIKKYSVKVKRSRQSRPRVSGI